MRLEVSIKEVHTVTVHLEADSLEEALSLANDIIEEGYDALDLEYSHTLDKDQWTVMDKDTLDYLQ